MKTIFKYPLPYTSVATISMPPDAEILSVKNQFEQVVLYAFVDTSYANTETRTFKIAPTGHPIDETGLLFIDTVLLEGGNLVLHVFEVAAP